MSALKKLVLLAASLCLILSVSVVGAFALVNGPLSTGMGVRAQSLNVKAQMLLSGTNAGVAIPAEAFSPNKIDIDLSGNSVSSSIDNQVFVGQGEANAIRFVFDITNTGDNDFTISLSKLPMADNIIIKYFFSADGDASSLAEYLPGTAEQSTPVVSINQHVTFVVHLELENAGLDASMEGNIEFVFEAI